MDRAERTGLGVALVGHAGLIALLSLHLSTPPEPPSTERPIEVSLVQDVGLQQAAPPAPTPPSTSQAPEQGAPEEAAAPAEPAPVPKPAPPPPAPRPQPVAKPQPKAQPEPAPKPVEKPAPKPLPKPLPKSKPVEKPQPKPEPKPAEKPRPEAKPAARAKPAAAPVRPSARANPDRLASVVADAERAAAARGTRGEGTSATSTAPRARGSRLGSDFLKGLSAGPSKAPPSEAAPGATMNAKAAADIASAIRRQVQPCADRQGTLGPGAERIFVSINLKLNRDGTLAAPPHVVNHRGVDGDNRRYLDRVDESAVAAFTACSPLRGLPAELYDVPNGWRSFTLVFNLRG